MTHRLPRRNAPAHAARPAPTRPHTCCRQATCGSRGPCAGRCPTCRSTPRPGGCAGGGARQAGSSRLSCAPLAPRAAARTHRRLPQEQASSVAVGGQELALVAVAGGVAHDAQAVVAVCPPLAGVAHAVGRREDAPSTAHAAHPVAGVGAAVLIVVHRQPSVVQHRGRQPRRQQRVQLPRRRLRRALLIAVFSHCSHDALREQRPQW